MKLILLCAVCFTGTLLVQSKTVEFQQDIDAPEETIDNLDVFLSESEGNNILSAFAVMISLTPFSPSSTSGTFCDSL